MHSVSTIHVWDLEPIIQSEGNVSFPLANREITFELNNSHERMYAAKCLLKVRHPQSDVDSLLFKRFVRQGDRILDAGANIGYTALTFLSLGAIKVVALEPVPYIFDRLHTLASDDLITVEKALSAEEGQTEIVLSQSHNQGSSIKPELMEIFPEVYGAELKKALINTTTVDRLVDEHGQFDVWKLDIEGAEIDALRGASNTLLSSPPRIIFAELYADALVSFYQLVSATHPYMYRALIDVKSYQLHLCDPTLQELEPFYQTSPMYVFSQEEIKD
ncbi:MAG: FkbM family methyltransferase [Hafnia alvei]|uniref:FkbM family methyltransferase n=1 Tax=Hafnia alvei TaxID=569 RepID=UPI003F902D92